MAKRPEPAKPEPVQNPQEQRLYGLIVIGSSAGGIEAIGKVLAALPADFPLPIVVAQHLDPQYPSRLAEILARSTRLPVHTITDHEPLAPGVVYVAPEARHVEIDDGCLRLLLDGLTRPVPSINRLLSSAAQAYDEHLIAVILTGTGSDGADGAREVKVAGGTVIVENPETAAYPGMPSSLAPTTVDLAVDLERIGPLLHELVSGTAIALVPPTATVTLTAAVEGEEEQWRALQTILAQVRERSGIDFASYKRPTILRRLQRRIAAVHVSDLADYARYLADHPDEYRLLAASFLIKVTEFFRDPRFFAVLRERVLPDLIAQARTHGNVLRIWSAGCATGEEAYSLAILVAEALGDELAQFTVQIFATDVDREAITFARRGIYPGSALAEAPEAIRVKYFSKLNGNYEVAKQVRGLVVFGLHDLGRQAPFPHVDLVLCRNVLIYFTPELQARALQLFAFALRSGGYLMLGKAETVHPLEAYFAPADGQFKLFRRRGERILAPISKSMNLRELLLPRAKLEPQETGRPSPFHGVHGAARDIGTTALAQPPSHPAPGTDEWLGSLVMGLPLGVVVVDRHYDIQAINGLALRLFGIYTAPLGEDLIHLTQSIPTRAMRTAIDAVLQGRGVPEAEAAGAAAGVAGRAGAAGLAAAGGYNTAEAVVTVETVLGERRHLRIACYPYVPGAETHGATGAEGAQGADAGTASTAGETGETAAPPRTAEVELVLILVEDVTSQVEAQRQEAARVGRERTEQATRQMFEQGEHAHARQVIEEENARLKQAMERVSTINRTLLEANQSLSETVLQLRRTNDELVIDHEEAQANAEEVKTLNEELQATNEEHVTVNEELEATVEELHVANDELQARSSEMEQSAEALTAQRMASEAARARLEAILLSLGDAVLVVDRAGGPLLTNAAYAAMFGGANAAFLAEDESGTPLAAAVTPQQRAARGETFTMEFTLTDADGARRWFEVSGQPIHSAGEDVGGVLAIRDITKRTLQRLQDEFVGLASHELRTPLTPLTAYLDMLGRLFADRPEDDRARIYTARAQHQTQRLQRMVQDLLDVNRLQNEKFTLNMEPVRLDEVVAGAVEAAQTMTVDQTIHFERPDTPLVVNGDAIRLEQVFMNLLTNAITYAPQSQRIDVRLRRVGDEAEVQVQDYGAGIPAADLPHLFSRFYQVMRTDGERPSRRGLGLGLYIAREVVVAHGGRIEVASIEEPRDGHGTTFTIHLLLAPQSTADHPTKGSAPHGVGHRDERHTGAHSRSKGSGRESPSQRR